MTMIKRYSLGACLLVVLVGMFAFNQVAVVRADEWCYYDTQHSVCVDNGGSNPCADAQHPKYVCKLGHDGECHCVAPEPDGGN